MTFKAGDIVDSRRREIEERTRRAQGAEQKSDFSEAACQWARVSALEAEEAREASTTAERLASIALILSVVAVFVSVLT